MTSQANAEVASDGMRIDRYLKLSRLVKRRTAAQEMAEVGAVRINGRVVKPASAVRVGDTVDVAYPRRVLTVEVTTGDERAMKRGATSYIIREERRVSEDEKPW